MLTDEEAEKRIKWRKLRSLQPLPDVLPPDWKTRYDEWTAELGKPEHTEYTMPPIQFRMGHSSPRNFEDLRAMPVEEIIAFLSEWQPENNDPFGASPEGLGQEITQLVTLKPQEFAAVAESFQGLDPTYVRALISGIKNALKELQEFSWTPVLQLCHWVMNQRREIADPVSSFHERDENWITTRAEIAELLSAVLNTDTEKIPFEFRQNIWDILKPLTEDPQPTPEHEAKYGGDNMDPHTLSLNTVRGEAMRALIKYALWVRRHIEKTDDAEERLARGFEEMPEVREILNLHLDPEYEPSLAVRAVYGEWLPWLALLDRSWVRENLAKIFPKEEGLHSLYSAAWGTYFLNQPYDDIFEILKEEYKFAIESIDSGNVYESYLVRPGQRLADHLINLYLRGKLSLQG